MQVRNDSRIPASKLGCFRPASLIAARLQGETPMPVIAEGLANVATIDFEASCLPSFGRSWPIEVGVCDVDDGRVWSWLIRPPTGWKMGWDPQAESKHGISRERLEAEGIDAASVYANLIDLTPRYRLLSDSDLDQGWVDTLAAAIGKPSPFVIDNARDLYDQLSGAGPFLEWSDVHEAEQVAHRRFPTVHRAGADAQRLAEVIRQLRQMKPDFEEFE
jgi:hypothetical protein